MITKKLYKIPLHMREITVSNFGFKGKCMKLDGVGFFIRYDKENELDPNFIRRHLAFRKGTFCIVEADTPEDAVKTFYEEWEGAKIGGQEEEAKALWIDRELEIEELPYCENLNISSRGEYICGTEEESGNGEFGMCVLEQYDPPDDCPIADYREKIYLLEEDNRLPIYNFKSNAAGVVESITKSFCGIKYTAIHLKYLDYKAVICTDIKRTINEKMTS